MKINTGKCGKCKKPISENGEANRKRLCEEHYALHKEKQRINIEKRINKIADKVISSHKLSQLEELISKNKVQAEISRKRIRKQWISGSIKRKSDVKDILESREWKNTQELIRKKEIVCVRKQFLDYVQTVCHLYLLKLFYSREYLNKNNPYNKYIVSPLGDVSTVVTLKLEVAFSFNPNSNVSIYTDDIILIPKKIRRMVTMEKLLLKIKLQGITNQGHDNKKRSEVKKESIGIYKRICRENTPEEVSAFMNRMRKELKELPSAAFNKYPPFLYKSIEKSLPLFRLAQMEYIRIYQKHEVNIFVRIENELSHFKFHLESFAILSFHALMAGKEKGKEFLKQTLLWINFTSTNTTSSIEYLTNNIENKLKSFFHVDMKNKNEFIKLYNSFFSEDVIEKKPETETINSIHKNIFKTNFKI
ncbi:hypothetical protein NP224_25845 [Klebsiella michiganensis]|uniref:Reverse transcriptase n=1 Tax=Klebsiella michiganensis TaxID=1134687 RepID=A0AAX3CP38_9ENTR|nr:hypothetical protein [Klebsiella michiganensis]UWZ73559.1 hypothetical protein NP224_25845 [Klebsiella michiganensis]